jgi:hypothetical protein
VYEYAIDQFIARYCSEPRLAFNRIVVVRYRMHLESRAEGETRTKRFIVNCNDLLRNWLKLVGARPLDRRTCPDTQGAT